ncbi:hypothetical protein LM6186_10024 [Listeria monocytogenes]|nr:hypothetical protein LM500401_20024 [Listeria monocytogenes]CUK74678.1 hypothetical protein LM6186_10024 [Listeria monocytogenes]CUL09107.1 hypothetical protein LM701345_30024 [Listeria monocytogenes]CUL19199.1 hypothetical protein LM701481_10027 [Listeria monocytogenes]CUL73480.1 hypothetical protein LM80661_10024 [Listeria monocytogenes]
MFENSERYSMIIYLLTKRRIDTYATKKISKMDLFLQHHLKFSSLFYNLLLIIP